MASPPPPPPAKSSPVDIPAPTRAPPPPDDIASPDSPALTPLHAAAAFGRPPPPSLASVPLSPPLPSNPSPALTPLHAAAAFGRSSREDAPPVMSSLPLSPPPPSPALLRHFPSPLSQSPPASSENDVDSFASPLTSPSPSPPIRVQLTKAAMERSRRGLAVDTDAAGDDKFVSPLQSPAPKPHSALPSSTRHSSLSLSTLHSSPAPSTRHSSPAPSTTNSSPLHSPSASPPRTTKLQIPQAAAANAGEEEFVSPLQSPLPANEVTPKESIPAPREEKEPTPAKIPVTASAPPARSPPPRPPPAMQKPPSFAKAQEPGPLEHPLSPLFGEEKSAVITENRLVRDDLPAAASAAVGRNGAHGVSSRTYSARVSGGRAATAAARSWDAARVAAAALRVAAAVLCLVSFSVMVSDDTTATGWDGDAFGRYEEFRYAVAVNVIAFVYSAFQAIVAVLSRPGSYYFDLAADQVLAYLLMSASSSAASRNDVWVLRFGADSFTLKISAAVSASFFAFLTMALSSVLSARNVFSSLP